MADLVEEKIKAVYAEIERKTREAEDLAKYLSNQQILAKLNEDQEEEDLKRKGIIVGQHVPSLPSRLDLDPSRIAEYENFSSTVLVAKDLMVQNRTNFLRRTGNLPISDLAQAKKESNAEYMSQLSSDVPHYLVQTHAADARKERVSVRFAEAIEATNKAKKTRRMQLGDTNENKGHDNKGRKLPPSKKELLEHEKVLESINHKLNYLRNPRNDPSGVTKMLVKPKSYYVNKQIEESSQMSGSDTASLKKKYAKHPTVTDNPLFICEPSHVLFMDFNIGQKYTQHLIFRNTSAVIRSVRVLPPRSPLFTLSSLKYPPNCNAGMVAPGMAVTAMLTFIPKELGDFEDFISVETESGASKVRVMAQREPPKLSIPPIINIPDCLVGDATRSSLVCTNNGGTGKFIIFSDENDIADMDNDTASLRIPPFTIYPTTFILNKGDSVDLIVEFVPLQLGNLSRKFKIHCDNGQLREFTIQAKSKQVNVTIAEIDRILFDYQDKTVYHDINYSSIVINSDKTRQLVVINDTGLPMEYEWVWMDANVSKEEVDKVGQELINQRQGEERPFSVQEGHPSNSLEDKEANPKTNNSLLRSLKQTLDVNPQDDPISNDHENRVCCGALEIYPARGVIAGEGAAEFRVCYAPKGFETMQLQAVMMIKSVPKSALPTERQMQHLENLSDYGHGQYMRLKSWVNDLGISANIHEHVQPNGTVSTSAVLVQLSTIIALVTSQVHFDEQSDNGWQEEVVRFHKIMHLIVKHNYNCRKTMAISDDSSVEGDNESVVENKPEHVALELFDWNGDAVSNPVQIMPYVMPDDVNTIEDEDGDEDEAEQQIDYREYNTAEKEMLAELWFDSYSATIVMGNAISSLLNDRVMHEAVEYLKDCALNNLSLLQFNVQATSEKPFISVHPACVEVGGDLSVCREFECSVTLTNHSNAPVQLKVDKDNFNAQRVYSSFNDDISEDVLHSSLMDTLEILKSYFTLRSDFDYVLLMPKSTETYKFVLTCTALGKFELSLPLTANDGNATVDSVRIHLSTTGPRVRFQVAEIDLGLLGVGQEDSTMLTFFNESDVPAMFIMKPQLFVDTAINALKRGATEKNNMIVTSRPNTNRDGQNSGRSARSTLSRQSSMHSDDFSVANSEATSTDFKIELKNAIVMIEPPTAVIPANSSITVQVTGKAGKVPQRIRGMIEARIFDQSGKLEVSRQYLNLRGEVQAPKVVLHPMQQSLGQVYVGRPVNFQLTLENICNLPTKFKFLRPGGQSAMFDFTLAPIKGSLEAKEKLVIEGTFTAINTGLIDDVISCKLFGISLPLGFSIKAVAKGITLDFVNLAEDAPLPLPLADPQDTQFPSVGKPPEPGSIEPIELGAEVPLYERRVARFVIRNLSAIAASFQIRPKKFVIMEGKGKRKVAVLEAPSTASMSIAARKDLVLAPHEEGTERFQSDAGKKYIGTIVDRRDDRRFLKSGLGASYAFNCPVGIVAPWGVQEVYVFSYNDIPGCYDDDIEISVHENEIIRKFTIPVKMNVIGCPIVIEKSTVGMTIMSKGPTDLLGKQLLQLGEACEFGPPLVREFYMKNHGSKGGQIRWMIRGLASKMNGPIKYGLNLDPESGKVKSNIRFWDDLAKESPFIIEPNICSITPYGKAKFKVTLSRNSPAAMERAQLTAKITIKDDPAEDDEDAKENDNYSISEASQASSSSLMTHSHSTSQVKKQIFSLQLLVEGRFSHPRIALDKSTFELPFLLTEVPLKQALAMKAKATVLFSSDGKLGQPCSKFITVVNPMELPVVVNLHTEGSLAIQDVQEPSNKVQKESTVVRHRDGASVTSNSASSHGKTISLGPDQQIKFTLAFLPRKHVREQLLGTFGTEAGKPTENISYLLASYPTGQTLRVPVVTSISTPFISGSSPRLNFGICHTRLKCQALYLLRNPTDVPARWTVKHVVDGGKWKIGTAIRVKGFEKQAPDVDDPSVFIITPDSGLIEGPTVSVSAAMAAPPKDFNRLEDSIVPERLVQSSWALNTLTLGDSLELKHQHKPTGNTIALPSSSTMDSTGSAGASGAQTCYPLPLTIVFSPKKNVSYCSRFRFECEFANSFDVVLQGYGTYEEHEHKPLNPVPR